MYIFVFDKIVVVVNTLFDIFSKAFGNSQITGVFVVVDLKSDLDSLLHHPIVPSMSQNFIFDFFINLLKCL